jgi:hypothetical protein
MASYVELPVGTDLLADRAGNLQRGATVDVTLRNSLTLATHYKSDGTGGTTGGLIVRSDGTVGSSTERRYFKSGVSVDVTVAGRTRKVEPLSASVESRVTALEALEVDAMDYGAVADGASHPLSGVYATLADAQAVYPHATALSDELDWAAIQAAVNALPSAAAVSNGHFGGTVRCPKGTYVLNRAVVFTARNRVTLEGDGRRSTQLRSSGADTILLDFSGTDAATWLKGGGVRDMEIRGSGNTTTHTQPVMRCYYSQYLDVTRVNFINCFPGAVAGVQFWDSRFDSCRFDFASKSGTAAVWLKCSDQGVSSGFGFTTDNCNNVDFHNCTWESNRGLDLWLDGRQQDGTYNSGRRINEITCSGRTKMESADDLKATGHIKIENAADITFEALQATLKGVTGSAVDFVSVNNTQALKIVQYTPETVEHTSAAVRTFLSLAGTNTGIYCPLTATAQTTNKPTVAAIEFSGTNNLDIDVAATYRSNPGSATLYSGAATSWRNDPDQGQTVVPGASGPMVVTTSRTSVGSAAYWTRYRPKRPRKVATVKFSVTVASGGDDECSVAIYDSTGATRLATTGIMTGKLNSTGIKTGTLGNAVQLDPDTTYLVCFTWGTLTAAGATLTGFGLANGDAAKMNGSTIPVLEMARQFATGTPHPAPTSLTLSGEVSATAAVWLVDA